MSAVCLIRRGAQAAWLMLLVASLVGCRTEEKKTESDGGIYTIPVEVAPAEVRSLTVTKTYSGPLEGGEQANIVARLSERVTGVKVHIGETVHAGQIILSLDKGGPASQFIQAEAQYKNADKTLGRTKSLLGEAAVSQQAVDGAQTAFDVARANFDAARANVELTTPIAGVVAAINVSDGDLAVPGSMLATIASVSQMKVIFNVNESDVANLFVGQHVTIYSESSPERLDGRIILLSRSADPRSRLFEAKALFRNTLNRWFRPGMFCKVDVEIAPSQKSAVIPNAAILSDGATDRVFVIRDGRAFERTVRIGVSDGQSTAILEGLTGGEMVATAGISNLKDSSVVTVVNK